MFNSQGKIITFYSYKGGVGRSMILANIAWILASNGKRVLVIDWDLEAPGIHRYFHPFLLDKNLTSTEGLIDFFRDFVDAAFTPINKNEGDDENWYEPFTDILGYAVSLDWPFPKKGTIDFVPAGKQGRLYATQVNSFNWDRFYEVGGGRFLEIVKEKMRREYDYILIDSRTGVSDTSGICTVQMPDILVVVFTGNNQSISGAVSVATSVIKQWQNDPNYSPPKWPIFPVLSRTDRTEKDKLDVTRDCVKLKFAPFLQHLSETERKEYWGKVEIPYIPWYAYEEVLVTFRDNPYQRDSLLSAIEQLVTYLTDKEIHELVAPSDLQREKILSKFIRQFSRNAPEKNYEDSPSPSIANNNPEIFVSYARIDNEPLPGLDKGWVTTLITRLQNLLAQKLDSYRAYSLWMDYDSRDNQSVTPSIIEKLESSAILLLILSPSYIESKWCREELSAFLSKVGNASGRIFIVERNNVERPTPISDLVAYKFWIRDDDGKLHTLGTPKAKTEEIEYYQILDDLANDLSYKIKSLREQAIPTTSAFSHNIFLAAVSEDLDKQRNEVKRYLEQQGIRVLPDKEYSFANIQQYLEQDLSQCSLFVQLLSDKIGHGLAQFQYEHAKKAKLPILQWRDRALDVNTVSDITHRTFLLQSTVFASNLVKFQDKIINELKSIENTEKTAASTKTKDLVFINAIPENMRLASQIAEFLTTQGIDCVFPLHISNHTSPTDIQNNLNENLLSCDAVIVLYTDDTPLSWVTEQVQYCRRIQAKREQDLKIIAVCNNSFTNKPSLSVYMPNLRVFKCPKLQAESGLSEFIRTFRR